jgi:D-alanyl-D-alanine carboxypeptidase (penicillin-binding protein 5/6)
MLPAMTRFQRKWPLRLAAAMSIGAMAVPLPMVSPAHAAPGPAIPCPRSVPAAPGTAPHPSGPPDADPAQRLIGGEQLDTTGLIIPVGVPSPPANTAAAWIVADLDTGEVLGACGPHDYATPASVQKLLLAATFVGKLDPKKVITVTKADLAIPADSSRVGLVAGGRYTIETLWLGLLLQSGNDAAMVLARLGGGAGGLAAGLQAMNDEAARLGATQTHAVTPSGYDAPGQFTSAYDLALIARACFANEAFRRYAVTQHAQIPAQPPRYNGFQIQNENQLIYEYPGALGGKTGFTSLARYTYVGAAKRNGRRLVVTLVGAEAHPQKGWQQGAALLDWGFKLSQGVSVGRLVDPGETAPSMPPIVVSPPVIAAVGESMPSTTLFVGAGGAAAAGMVVVVAGLMRRGRRGRRG